MKLNPLIIIKSILILFISVGLGLTLFMIKQDVKIIGAYIVSISFILGPGIILYGLIFGFSISEKTIKKQAETQRSLSFDNNGITYKLPLFDTTEFIDWKTIETVVYTNYQSDDNAQFIFYLTQPPIQSMTENPLWINRIFPFALRNKRQVTIIDECKNFQELPEKLQTYLANTNPVNLTEDYRKAILIRSKTTVKNNTIKTEEYWKPNNNYEREKVIYDKYNRTFEEIKQAKKA